MVVPKVIELFFPAMKILADEKEYSAKEFRNKIAININLSEDDKNELLPNGSTYKFANRVGWTSTYLKKAGLAESKKFGHLNITKEGLNLLKTNPQNITLDDLLKYQSFREFYYGTKDIGPTTSEPSTPEEIIEKSFYQIKNDLASNLLEKIKANSSVFFEKLVVDLLLKMGYGNFRKDAGEVTSPTGDEGIDGIINEDKLGLDKIYIQAKRYDKGVIGRPDIQSFAGALSGKGATKGVFITTSTFTRGAIEFAEKTNIGTIVLIDGKSLSNLMVDYGLGVSDVNSYTIKKIDSDYFDTE